jgi:hypothetical protein
VGKKEKNCDPDDPEDQRQGDHWDHVGLDAENRLVLSVVPGKRTAEKVQQLVADVKQRLGGHLPDLITTDEYPAYEAAILQAYGEEVVPQRTGKPGRPRNPYQIPPQKLKYATVHKTRKKGRVVKIDFRVIFASGGCGDGGPEAVAGEQGDQHSLCGTPKWDRPQPQRTEGAQDLLFLEGLGRASSHDLLHDVHL